MTIIKGLIGIFVTVVVIGIPVVVILSVLQLFPIMSIIPAIIFGIWKKR